ncbi:MULTISPECIES: hypothetical protein [Tatumella]|uniref:DNA utilization protein HofO C-terminal domain-containing protein n=1 Tax=Tatumella punctata TaxID=399969 RepID=A0ABW1VN89_9GAMM|nr:MULTISPECIES: hypothetical protein [unclassified Tatumella]MBS0855698.1 hypothetical protein [Tatumella sp. JGM16]MBS0893204.1 hypothetical protein [Tatumella sp. JGM130]MBS0912475.1 hypothetical protein [Tatumella sp. JGM91]
MTEWATGMLYRPHYQQWGLFLLTSACGLLFSALLLILPEWQRWQRSEQQYLRQDNFLRQQQEQLSRLLPAEQLRDQLLIRRNTQQQKTGIALEEILAGNEITLRRWRNTESPAEIQLQLDWPQVAVFFRQMRILQPSLLPIRFGLEYREEGLEMVMWLNPDE